jgi:hypothetical protein
MKKIQSYTRSMGELSMINNINGKQTKQQIDWDGNIENLGDNKANVELSTDWNGMKKKLSLKNAAMSKISQNKRFQQFFKELSAAKKMSPISPVQTKSIYNNRRPRQSRRRRPTFSTRRRRW